ncbi:MAG: MarR family transcriptional regulator [Carboxydocellales bacterium]
MINLQENVDKYLTQSWRHMQAYLAMRMEPLHIGVGQYVYLIRLYNEDGQSQQCLSNGLLVDKAATVRAINKLEQTGYVYRAPDPADKRSFKIYLTKKGRNIRPELENILEEMLAVLLKDLSSVEGELIKKLLKHMAKNIVTSVRGNN